MVFIKMPAEAPAGSYCYCGSQCGNYCVRFCSGHRGRLTYRATETAAAITMTNGMNYREQVK